MLRYPVVGSTNDVGRTLAREGCAPWTVVLADRQSGGRGRLGRAWESPVGNVYSTVILRPKRSTVEWPSLSLVVALAVRDAISRWVDPGRIRLKWPNDVLVYGAKISGVLLETVTDPTPAILIGTGLNVAAAPDGATSLSRFLEAPPRADDVTNAYLSALASRVAVWERQGFPALRTAWLEAAAHRGRAVLVRTGERVEEGRLIDLGDDGTLVIEDEDGHSRRFSAGDLVLVNGD